MEYPIQSKISGKSVARKLLQCDTGKKRDIT